MPLCVQRIGASIDAAAVAHALTAHMPCRSVHGPGTCGHAAAWPRARRQSRAPTVLTAPGAVCWESVTKGASSVRAVTASRVSKIGRTRVCTCCCDALGVVSALLADRWVWQRRPGPAWELHRHRLDHTAVVVGVFQIYLRQPTTFEPGEEAHPLRGPVGRLQCTSVAPLPCLR